MKKFKDIIFGVLIGAIAFGLIVIVKPMYEMSQLRAEAESVDRPFTSAHSFSWLVSKTFNTDNPHYRLDYDDVFGNIHYENLYLFAFMKLFVEPEDDALREVAQQYGLTPAEADAVRAGAMYPLWNIVGKANPNLTQQDVMDMANHLREDFNDAYEMYSLQQDLDLAVRSSEMFSNGSIADSGFDLVHDLTLIEEILFAVNTPTTIGGNINDDVADPEFTPYQEATDEEKKEAVDVPDIYDALEPKAVKELAEEDGGPIEEEELEEEFEGESLVEILDEDVCPEEEEDPVEVALDTYEKEAQEYYEEHPEKKKLSDDADVSEAEQATSEESEPENFADKLKPAEADVWLDPVLCDGKLHAGLWGNASGGPDIGGDISMSEADYYLCLETNVKWETYTSYVPADTCIACELEKIKAYMDKTLSHSLTPNKVTGNYLESAKCKDSVSTPFVDIQFFVIWEPIKTPDQDDAIFGKSIINEWNKFVERENPFALNNDDKGILGMPVGASLLIEHQTQVATDQALSYSKPGESLSDLMSQIQDIEQGFARQQEEGVDQYEVKSKGEDFVIYAQTVMKEIGQMTEYFRSYMDMFKKLSTETCPALKNKKTIQ